MLAGLRSKLHGYHLQTPLEQVVPLLHGLLAEHGHPLHPQEHGLHVPETHSFCPLHRLD